MEKNKWFNGNLSTIISILTIITMISGIAIAIWKAGEAYTISVNNREAVIRHEAILETVRDDVKEIKSDVKELLNKKDNKNK